MPIPEPDSATVDAWLAGDLPAEEAAEVECYFGQNDTVPPPDESDETIAPELLQDLSLIAAEPEVAALVDIVKTQHAPDMPAPSDEAWREALTPCDDPILLGTIGDYEIIELIATGGMGIVFKARDPELDRVAAIKVLSPELATNATARERFLREARAAAKLEHENILPIYGVHDEAVPYFAMRHAAGGTLQNAIDGGEHFDLDRLKSITHQVAAALGAAHENGIIHRDIKPANILFDTGDSDKVWVCDFGIARSTEDPSLTYAGAVAGTPQYMSPEQAGGGELGGRSDLFSLGSVLYHCATGKHAFTGNTTAAVLQQVTNSEPTVITQTKTKLPKWFERLLANLLAKDPRDRPRNAAAVVRAIDDEHSPRPKHTARRNKRIAIAAVTVASLAVLAVGLLQIPAVKDIANKVLAARFDQAVTIEGNLGAYPDLAAAVAAAGDGDTIELPGGDPIAIDKLQLPLDKALTLKAADPDARPTLTTAISGAPGLIAHAPLHLVGLDFVLNPKRDSEGIVILRSTDAVIENCTFTARREVVHKYDDVKSRTVDLHDGATAEISGCQFDLEETNAITFFGSQPDAGEGAAPSGIRVRDCQMRAFYGVNIYNFRSHVPGVEIDISGLRFSGESFFKQSVLGVMPDIHCAVEDSEFTVAKSLCWLQAGDEQVANEHFRWQGTGNSFPTGNATVRVALRSASDTVSLRPVSDYAKVPPSNLDQPTANSPGWIEIAGTGKRYTDLAAALRDPPDGATLLLSGDLATENQILSIGDRTLHLRAAPGARPTVTAKHPTEHALFLFGDSTVNGIRFIRRNATLDSLPVLGLKPDGGDVLIEDCEFDTAPAPGQLGGQGLSLTNLGTATVRRCLFRHPGGTGLSINFVRDAKEPAKVVVEDCLFVGTTAVESRSRTADTTTHLVAQRCIAICDHLVAKSRYYPIYRFDIAFGNSIIDAGESLLSFPDTPLEKLDEHIGWTGVGNHYREGMPLLHARRERAGTDFIPTAFESFGEMESALTKVREELPTFAPLFDHNRLANPATPDSVLKALHPGVSSPALQTLDLLKSARAGR